VVYIFNFAVMPKKPTYKELEFRIKELQQESEERFRQLIKNSFDMIVLIGADGIQHYVSESCEKILGYKPEELTNIPVIEKMIHPDDREITIQCLQEIVAKKGVGGTQYRHRHKKGSWVYLEAFGTNQLDNPAVQSVVLNVRDITK
jgi:two-component system, sensor histidine kinase and response regulator